LVRQLMLRTDRLGLVPTATRNALSKASYTASCGRITTLSSVWLQLNNPPGNETGYRYESVFSVLFCFAAGRLQRARAPVVAPVVTRSGGGGRAERSAGACCYRGRRVGAADRVAGRAICR